MLMRRSVTFVSGGRHFCHEGWTTSDMHLSDDTGCHLRLTIVGHGRLGSALARALSERAGIELVGPLGRGADAKGSEAVLLCVPDAEIAHAAAAITHGPMVGHC